MGKVFQLFLYLQHALRYSIIYFINLNRVSVFDAIIIYVFLDGVRFINNINFLGRALLVLFILDCSSRICGNEEARIRIWRSSGSFF